MNKLTGLFLILSLILVLTLEVCAQRNAKIELKASIQGISSGDISKELLLTNGYIQCSDQKYNIVYFNFSLLRENGDLIVYNGRGNHFSEAMKAEIKLLNPGSKLVIEEIGAKSSDEKIIKLPSIALVMK